MALTNSLVASYGFDSGAETTDDHGDNTLSTEGTPGSAAGKIGEAASYNGSSAYYVQLSSLTGGRSLEAWAYAPAVDGGGEVIAGIPGVKIIQQSDGSIRVEVQRVSDTFVRPLDSTTSFSAGSWLHIVFTFEPSTETIRLYINGTEEDARSDVIGGIVEEGSDRTSFGGERNQFFLASGWTGRTDLCRAWSRVLTSTEVSDLYNSGAGLSYSDLSFSSATYTVSGTVTESDGTTAIDGASVTLDNVQGANAQSTTTDANGDYSLSVTVADSDLPDTWDVTADASGFTPQTKQVSASTSSTSYTTDFSLSGAAETVSFDTGTALADGFAPTITATPNTVSPGTAQAAAQGFSAGVTATQNTVAVGTAQATAQGFVPTISADLNTITATTGQAPAQGFDPTISEGAAGDTISAGLGTAQAQAFDPTISINPVTVTLGLGQAAAEGFAPDVVADPSEINTGQAQAAATGFDPTVTTGSRTVAPQLGTAQADGFEPAVIDGNVGVATTMEIEARPLYEIDVEARPLYRIQLFVKEQLP
jgi:hypothetical protein